MLKKSITYTDYNDQDITEDFYFNFTKLELLEKDLELGGIDTLVKNLTETQNAKEAYSIFKTFILAAYGEKSADGKRFVKTPEITAKFENSPALSELIMEFLLDPKIGAEFMEGCLPTKLVQDVKAVQEGKKKLSDEELQKMVQEAAARQENPETAVAPSEPTLEKTKTFDDYTHEELVAMPQEQFKTLVPSNPKDMTQPQLLIAFQRKNAS